MMEAIVAAKGVIASTRGRSGAAAMLRSAFRNPGRSVSGYDAASDQYFALGEIAGAGWSYASLLSGTAVRTEAFRAVQWVLWSGLGSLALLLACWPESCGGRSPDPRRTTDRGAEQIAGGDTQSARAQARPG
jgi:hypothetical protein